MLRLRPTVTEDIPALAEWEAAADTAGWLGETGPAWHSRALADPDQDHLLAVDVRAPDGQATDGQAADGRPPDGGVAGFAVLAGLTGGQAIELRRMAVHPARRGTGLGRALLEAVVARCRERHGATEVWLDVKGQNHRARALYESAGFTVTNSLSATITEPDGTRPELIFMSRRL
ncbi:MAG: GNAT family N-acetyltransferase [Actinobacteria bacterium]|nr:GNAT family N-acetyltransferase [Actinomycetota bacterium]